MTTLSVRVADTLAGKLAKVAKESERSKSFIIQKALETYLEDYADLQIALNRLSDAADPVVSRRWGSGLDMRHAQQRLCRVSRPDPTSLGGCLVNCPKPDGSAMATCKIGDPAREGRVINGRAKCGARPYRWRYPKSSTSGWNKASQTGGRFRAF